MKVGLCTIAFRERLLTDALDIAREVRADGVEIWGREPHVSPLELDRPRAEAVARMVEARGLELVALGSYHRLGVPEKAEGNVPLTVTLRTAHALRAPLVRVWAGDLGSDRATEEDWQRVIAAARLASLQAETLGLTLLLEMHDDTLTDTGATARRMVEEVACDNVALVYQPSLGYEAEDPLARLEQVAPFVQHVHAQNAEPPEHPGEAPRRTLIGRGVVDYRALAGRLAAAGYGGYLQVEFVVGSLAEKVSAAAADVAYLRSITDRLPAGTPSAPSRAERSEP